MKIRVTIRKYRVHTREGKPHTYTDKHEDSKANSDTSRNKENELK